MLPPPNVRGFKGSGGDKTAQAAKTVATTQTIRVRYRYDQPACKAGILDRGAGGDFVGIHAPKPTTRAFVPSKDHV
jgi:hypothetical protein